MKKGIRNPVGSYEKLKGKSPEGLDRYAQTINGTITMVDLNIATGRDWLQGVPLTITSSLAIDVKNGHRLIAPEVLADALDDPTLKSNFLVVGSHKQLGTAMKPPVSSKTVKRMQQFGVLPVRQGGKLNVTLSNSLDQMRQDYQQKKPHGGKRRKSVTE